MGTRMFLAALTATACLHSVGCTHTQLRRNTISQIGTLDEIYTQQVMDNLAKFAYSPNSLPHFASADTGTSNVTDKGTLVGGITGQKGAISFFLQQLNLNGTASRQAQETWTLTPVTDPHKLALMRCAYQSAVASCGRSGPSGDCPNCVKMLEDFHGHEKSTDYKIGKDGRVVFHQFETTVPCKPKKDGSCRINEDGTCKCKSESCKSEGNRVCETAGIAKCEPVLETTNVGITEDCIWGLSQCGWLGMGTKDDVPEDCGCVYVGHYCDQYVWVLPCHRDKLTQLTLAIMDYATYEPPASSTKEVTLYLCEDGTEVDKDSAAQVVVAQVPINTPQSKIRETLGVDPPKVDLTAEAADRIVENAVDDAVKKAIEAEAEAEFLRKYESKDNLVERLKNSELYDEEISQLNAIRKKKTLERRSILESRLKPRIDEELRPDLEKQSPDAIRSFQTRPRTKTYNPSTVPGLLQFRNQLNTVPQ